MLSSTGHATTSGHYRLGRIARGWTSPPPPEPQESLGPTAGRMEQLVDMGLSDPASSGLNYHETFRKRIV